MKIRYILVIAVILVIALASPCAAKPKTPFGILAASVGEKVVLLEASHGGRVDIETGPVGWLFPAPGGVVFAPDVIGGRTTVIDLRTQQVADRIDGLTMPHFGDSGDRYIAIAGDVFVLSYPERAVLARIESEIAHPWQAIVGPDQSVLLVLDRLPDGSDGIYMSTVNLLTNQVVSRRRLSGDVRHMALSRELAVLALADAAAKAVHLVAPATLTPIVDRPTRGRPVDVVFAHEDRALVTAVDRGDKTGVLDVAFFKGGKKGLRFVKAFAIDLPAAPVRIAASPDGVHVAVAMEGGAVTIVDVDKKEIAAVHRLPDTPRDLRWCDPTDLGPDVPKWSDGTTEDGTYDPYVPKVTDGPPDGR